MCRWTKIPIERSRGALHSPQKGEGARGAGGVAEIFRRNDLGPDFFFVEAQQWSRPLDGRRERQADSFRENPSSFFSIYDVNMTGLQEYTYFLPKV